MLRYLSYFSITFLFHCSHYFPNPVFIFLLISHSIFSSLLVFCCVIVLLCFLCFLRPFSVFRYFLIIIIFYYFFRVFSDFLCLQSLSSSFFFFCSFLPLAVSPSHLRFHLPCLFLGPIFHCLHHLFSFSLFFPSDPFDNIPFFLLLLLLLSLFLWFSRPLAFVFPFSVCHPSVISMPSRSMLFFFFHT